MKVEKGEGQKERGDREGKEKRLRKSMGGGGKEKEGGREEEREGQTVLVPGGQLLLGNCWAEPIGNPNTNLLVWDLLRFVWETENYQEKFSANLMSDI